MRDPEGNSTVMVNKELIRKIRGQFALDWRGIHGSPHWSRVLENGRRLSETTGARLEVVELFAFLHDSRRLNDGFDPGHGARAARFAESLQGTLFELAPDHLDLLTVACRGHSDGMMEGDPTVLTCWDADRLDPICTSGTWFTWTSSARSRSSDTRSSS